MIATATGAAAAYSKTRLGRADPKMRCFLSTLVLFGLMSAPAAQQVASAELLQSAAIPDFSGVWHRWFRPGLGPAESGPGPVTNRSLFDGVSDYNKLVGDYTNPILKPE